TLNARQGADLVRDAFVKRRVCWIDDTWCRWWDVERKDLPRVEPGIRPLERDERGDQHSGAGEQHERERDLCRGEQGQTTVGGRCDPNASARQSETTRCLRRGQPGHVGE